MGIEEIKKEFITFMEKAHQGLLFPKNYFGCMMAVFIEQKPITQGKIQELTGYSKTTISQMIKLMQMNIQLEKVKKPKIRKKFYAIETPPRDFMLKFLRRIMDAYQNKAEFVLPLREELELYEDKHIRFKNFNSFLKKLHESSIVYLNLIAETTKELEDLIHTGQTSGSSLISHKLMESPENLKYLQELMKAPQPSESSSDLPEMSEKLSKIYIQFKNKFFQQFQANLTVNESQLMAARRMIGMELLLENRPITQEEIENTTHLARSLISDALNLLLDWKIVRLLKKPKDRKNYYMMNQSWDVRLIGRLRINKKYADEISQKISALIEEAKVVPKGEFKGEIKVETKKEFQLDEKLSFITILEHISHSFFQYGQYFKFLEVKYLNGRLKTHLNRK